MCTLYSLVACCDSKPQHCTLFRGKFGPVVYGTGRNRKRIKEIWLAEQEKKDRKKKPSLEKSVEEEEDDDDFEFVVDKFDDKDDFIPFEDEKESENEGEKCPAYEECGACGACEAW